MGFYCPAKERNLLLLCMLMELLNDLPSQPIPDYNMPFLIKRGNSDYL